MDKVLCAIIKEPGDSFYEAEIVEQGIILPLINHPHNDKENGQNYVHYHIDTRYLKNQQHLYRYKVPNNWPLITRVTVGEYKLDYFMLKKTTEFHGFSTDISNIRNSKLKHRCIFKGKCPHRGFDLSNVKAIAGIITCPLHSLKFDETTKQIIL